MKSHTIVGKLEILNLVCDSFLVSKNRKIRVWLPSSYSAKSKQKYDVIYMFDAQNLFDKATSFVEEWEIDESITYLEQTKHIKPSIVVGLDNSKDRLSEYLPRFSNIAIGDLAYKSDKTFSFLINQVIPLIESKYNVNKTKKSRSIGGSSMGGLMALEAGIKYSNIFNNIYAFSPAFPIYKYGLSEEKPAYLGTNDESAFNYVIKQYTSKELLNKVNIFITAGGQGIEKNYSKYPPSFVNKLVKAGYDQSKLKYKVDKKYEHNEIMWNEFFYEAYQFFKSIK